MPTDDEFIVAQIAAVELRIAAVNSAMLTVANGGTSYSFDDGQTRQSVTRGTMTELTRTLNSLLNMRATLLAQLGRGQTYVRPGF